MSLQRAQRKQVPLKGGLSGASGSGKTYSALLMASGMTTWDKIAVIDTENRSAELYSHLGKDNTFFTLPLSAPFTPEKYIAAIKECEASGMKVIIIDSITHEWEGPGGCLEIQNQLGGRYQDWAKVTPRHQSFLNAILFSPCHILTTVRRKQDYEMSKDQNGKVQITKVGLREVTREGFEYELHFSLEIGINHLAKASKDRTGLFMDLPEFKITQETGKALMDWSNSGAPSLIQKDVAAAVQPVIIESGVIPESVSTEDVRKALQKFSAAINNHTGEQFGVSMAQAEMRAVSGESMLSKVDPKHYAAIIARLEAR